MRKIDYVVHDPGIYLGKSGERLVVRKDGRVAHEYPLRMLRSVVIAARGVCLSSDLVQACCEHGVQLDFLDYGRRPVAKLVTPHQIETVDIVRAQFDALHDARGLELARDLVAEKLRSKVRLLHYLGRRSSDPELLEAAVGTLQAAIDSVDTLESDGLDAARPVLLGLEGSATRAYWRALATTIPADAAGFTGREGRGATDLVNSMLNYGFAILYARVWGMVELAGLHPFAGLLHKDRSGKPALVLDLVEPWRVLVEDAVFSAVRRAKRELPRTMTEPYRKAVTRDVCNRFDAPRTYGGLTTSTYRCMLQSTRNVGMFLRGEAPLAPFRWDVRGPKVPTEPVVSLPRPRRWEG